MRTSRLFENTSTSVLENRNVYLHQTSFGVTLLNNHFRNLFKHHENSQRENVHLCSDGICSASFDHEEDLLEHGRCGVHSYLNHDHSSTNGRIRQIYVEHLKGERLADEHQNRTAINSMMEVNGETSVPRNRKLRNQSIFSTRGYALPHRQQYAKITDSHRKFFFELFQRGETSWKKISVEKAFEEMRVARGSNGSSYSDQKNT